MVEREIIERERVHCRYFGHTIRAEIGRRPELICVVRNPKVQRRRDYGRRRRRHPTICVHSLRRVATTILRTLQMIGRASHTFPQLRVDVLGEQRVAQRLHIENVTKTKRRRRRMLTAVVWAGQTQPTKAGVADENAQH